MVNIGHVALWLLATISYVNAFFLMGVGRGIYERLDPIVNPGGVSGHAHIVGGGGNFASVLTTDILRKSKCTSTPISEDKSSYWTDTMYFQWKNGSFTSLDGGFVIYYLYPGNVPAGTITAFPDDFRMISGTPALRTYDKDSFAQQAVTFLCLDFSGVSTRHNEIPVGKHCPNGIRAQINFPSCWDGVNVDSTDHKSHVAFPDRGPDSGICSDPKYPKTLPRIFIELYWGTGNFDYSQAMRPEQPFVLSQGDVTGYGHHADFFNGWDKGVLQRVVDQCTCPEFGDPTCCAQKGIFTYSPSGNNCLIVPTLDEQVLGTLDKLPGNNPVTGTISVDGIPVQAPPSATTTTATATSASAKPSIALSSKPSTSPGTIPPKNPIAVYSSVSSTPVHAFPSSSPAYGEWNNPSTVHSSVSSTLILASPSSSPTYGEWNIHGVVYSSVSITSASPAYPTDESEEDDENCDEDQSTLNIPATNKVAPTTTITQSAAPLVTMIKNGQKCIVRPGNVPPTLRKKERIPFFVNIARSKSVSHTKAHRHFQRMVDMRL